ncbi:hypothetical protein CIB48_g11433 [Xylaria polymorpha]|nr:hypothetical protein CIB48_g11433 [Xylaria polymorpha]
MSRVTWQLVELPDTYFLLILHDGHAQLQSASKRTVQVLTAYPSRVLGPIHLSAPVFSSSKLGDKSRTSVPRKALRPVAWGATSRFHHPTLTTTTISTTSIQQRHKASTGFVRPTSSLHLHLGSVLFYLPEKLNSSLIVLEPPLVAFARTAPHRTLVLCFVLRHPILSGHPTNPHPRPRDLICVVLIAKATVFVLASHRTATFVPSGSVLDPQK